MAQIGDTLPFLFQGRMEPFKIVRIIGNIYYVQSLDFGWEAKVRDTDWSKQKAMLEREMPEVYKKEVNHV